MTCFRVFISQKEKVILESAMRGSINCLLFKVSETVFMFLFSAMTCCGYLQGSHSFVLFLKILGTLSRPVPGCPSFKPASPQGSPQLSRSLLFSSSSRRSPSKASYYGPQLGADAGIAHRECPCCCCNEDLLKLQVINWFME